MRITIEIDDEELRQAFLPVLRPMMAAPTLPPSPPSARLLTVREVAEQLGVGRNNAYALVAAGAIDSIAIGRSRRILPAALERFITTAEATPFRRPDPCPAVPTNCRSQPEPHRISVPASGIARHAQGPAA